MAQMRPRGPLYECRVKSRSVYTACVWKMGLNTPAVDSVTRLSDQVRSSAVKTKHFRSKGVAFFACSKCIVAFTSYFLVREIFWVVLGFNWTPGKFVLRVCYGVHTLEVFESLRALRRRQCGGVLCLVVYSSPPVENDIQKAVTPRHGGAVVFA